MDAYDSTLGVNIDTQDKKEIINMFELCKSFQLPVTENDYLVGIVDLFEVINNDASNIDLRSILINDFYVAGENPSIFSFKMTSQSILPFVDNMGKYLGFSNRILITCYVPSGEYFKIAETSLPDDKELSTLEEYHESFDALIVDNYEGIYVTTKKGKTVEVNNKSVYLDNIQKNDVLDNEYGLNHVNLEEKTHSEYLAQTAQVMQERKEIATLRLTRDMYNLPKIQQEMDEVQKLADKYKAQLDTLKTEQNIASQFVFNSIRMKKIMDMIIHISHIDSTILIQGDSGVGKGLLAKLIHENSQRKHHDFITIDCASLPPHLIESELFGYESGSFTGAEKGGRIGLVEMANNGTLFLDEIGELPYELQSKLLRMIQDKVIYRVGGNTPINIDARVISATNRDLEEMVKEKLFRSDLYYRLKVIPIEIPPLSERKEDIKPLIDHFIKKFNDHYGLSKSLSTSALKKLIDYSWPGNVREIENTLEYILVTTNSNLITLDDLNDNLVYKFDIEESLHSSYSAMSLKKAKEKFEKELISNLVNQFKSTKELAEHLEIDRSTTTRKLIKYDINIHSE